MLNVEKIRQDFPMFANNPSLVYMDNGATTFKPQCVIDRINYFYTHQTSNIHRGEYDISFNVSKQYDQTRSHIAKFLNAKDASEIVFTSGTTQGLNWIALSYGLNNVKQGDVILTTDSEHASSILPWFNVVKKNKAKIEYIKQDSQGFIEFNDYQDKLRQGHVKVVAIAHVSNVLACCQDVKKICQLAHQYGAIAIIDGAQSVPHMKIDVQDMDCDFLCFSGHKLCGPSGIGVMYGKKTLLDAMEPVNYGGGSNARFNSSCGLELKESPEKFESGTPAIEQVLGLDSAISYLENIGMDNIQAYEEELKRYAIEKLSTLDNLDIYNKNTSGGIVSFNVKGIFAQDVASYLNSFNIAVRTGNHCAKILVDLIGTDSTVRASFYFYTTKQDIDKLYDALKDITLEKCIACVI